MTIQLKTVCPEIIGKVPRGEYAVDEGLTALQALVSCLNSQGMPVPEEARLLKLMYVINNQHVKADAPLKEGDKLMVLRPVIGG